MNKKYQIIQTHLFEDENELLTDTEKERESSRLERVRKLEKGLRYFLAGSIVIRLLTYINKEGQSFHTKVIFFLGNMGLTFFAALAYIIGKIAIYYNLKFKSECIKKCKLIKTDRAIQQNCINDCRHKAYQYAIDKLDQEKNNCKALNEDVKIKKCEKIIQKRIDVLVENQKSYSEYTKKEFAKGTF